MRFYRHLAVFVPVAGLVLLTGALRNPFAADAGDAPLLSAALAARFDAPAHPGATAAVEQAIAGLADPARPWLRADVAVRCLIPEARFSAAGTFWRAAGGRFRMEVSTRSGPVAAAATVLSIADGNDLWQATSLRPGEYRDVQRLRLAEICSGTDGLARLADVRQRLLSGPGIRGPELTLRSVHGHVRWVDLAEGGGERQILGAWHRALLPHLVTPGKPWPANLPRLCRLTLRGEEAWPTRLQWWGPTDEGGPDRLLAEVEFTQPVRDRVLPADECDRLFSFHPGAAPVTDVTAAVRAAVDPRP